MSRVAPAYHGPDPARMLDRISLREGPMRVAPARCDHHGCDRATKEGKPRCALHFLDMPYPQALAQRVEAQEQEAKRLRRWLNRPEDTGRPKGQAPTRGYVHAPATPLLLEDVLSALAAASMDRGAVSVERLCRDAGPLPTARLAPDAMDYVLRVLAAQGKAWRNGVSKRGTSLWSTHPPSTRATPTRRSMVNPSNMASPHG